MNGMSRYMIQSGSQPRYFVRLGGRKADSVGTWPFATAFSARRDAREALRRLKIVSPEWARTWALRVRRVTLSIEPSP